ncbi:MAG: hypothetical protein M3Y42_09175 [Actinomycetota bacterium]|nr:hypothetical protein [Actinomycetota bacterium]
MPQLTRRSVLVLGGALGLAAFSRPTSAAAVPASGPRIPLRSSFARATGTIVTATDSQRSYRLRLAEILDLGQSGQFDPQLSFNLIFRNAGSTELIEGIYRLGSSRLPATSLLLSPTGRAGGKQVQAVVNRSA